MFGFLFRKKDVSQPPAKPPVEDEIIPQSEVIVTRRLNNGLPVEVLLPDGTGSFQGRITSENNLSLIIGRLPGEMTLRQLEKGVVVTILAYNSDLEHVRITATVVDSTTLRLVLRGWVLEDNRSKRTSKRLPLEIPGKLYGLEDTRMLHPKECVVLDLSETGARIQSLEKLQTGDAIRLQLEVFKGDGLVSMPSQVVWVAATDLPSSEYGLVFAEMEQRKVRDLRNSLKELEQQLKRTTMR